MVAEGSVKAMRFGVCDDTANDRKLLLDMLRAYCDMRGLTAQVDQFPNASALLDAFEPGKYQILFLDIYMPGLTGMQAARTIREKDADCMLVFATTSEDHAMESYGVYAAGYLLKPYTAARLGEAMDWCMENMLPLAQTVEIMSEREKVQLSLGEITFIEVYGREAVFHTTGKTYSTNRSLTELEQELPEDFLRCHRSYIVNMNHIARAEQKDFALKDGTLVPVSIEGGGKIKQKFFDWMFRRTWEGR